MTIGLSGSREPDGRIVTKAWKLTAWRASQQNKHMRERIRDLLDAGITHDTKVRRYHHLVETPCGRVFSLVPLGWRLRASGEITTQEIDCMACITATAKTETHQHAYNPSGEIKL